MWYNKDNLDGLVVKIMSLWRITVLDEHMFNYLMLTKKELKLAMVMCGKCNMPYVI